MRAKMQTAQNQFYEVESYPNEPCSLVMISPTDLVAEGITQGLEQHNIVRLKDHYIANDNFLDDRHAADYRIVLINARLIRYPLADFF